MPQRVADDIEEIARSNRGDQQEKPQIQADPAVRRPRLIRNTPAAAVVALVLAGAVAVGWAVYWVLGVDAVSERQGLSFAGQLPVRIAAAAVVGVVVGGFFAWAFRPAQSLRRATRTWATTARRRTSRVPLFGSLTAAILIGVGLAALATWIVSGAVFERATSGGSVDVVKAALPAIAGVVLAVALVVVYRRQKDTERGQFAQRFGAASTQLGDSDTAVRIAGVYAMAATADESPVFARRQQCIDVLCGYLRLPYDPDARFSGRHVWFDGAVFSGPNTSFEDVEFNAEVVSFDGASFDSDATFAGATFLACSASFDSPAEWKNVKFDWDNPKSGTQPAIPRCMWRPSLVG